MSKEAKGFAIKDQFGDLFVDHTPESAWACVDCDTHGDIEVKKSEGYTCVPVSIKEDEGEEGWISVADRLPEIGGEYNVVWELSDGEPPVSTTMDFEFKTKQWVDGKTDSDCTSEVTHWQELPNPPQS